MPYQSVQGTKRREVNVRISREHRRKRGAGFPGRVAQRRQQNSGVGLGWERGTFFRKNPGDREEGFWEEREGGG